MVSQFFIGEATFTGDGGESELIDNTVKGQDVWNSMKASIDANKEKLLPVKLDSSWGHF